MSGSDLRPQPNQVSQQQALATLIEAVREERLAQGILMAVLSGPASELNNELTALGGQLGYSWEIVE